MATTAAFFFSFFGRHGGVGEEGDVSSPSGRAKTGPDAAVEDLFFFCSFFNLRAAEAENLGDAVPELHVDEETEEGEDDEEDEEEAQCGCSANAGRKVLGERFRIDLRVGHRVREQPAAASGSSG